MIPYGRQSISEEDIQAVVEVLRSDWLTQGPTVGRFEQALCDLTGARHCIAVANGTMALHLACLALGVGPGDRGITSPISFMASANCIAYCGGTPDFADIDPHTLCLSPEQVETKCQEGPVPKVVIPVDFAGVPADLPRFRELADRYGFFLIEDAAHAIGSTYQFEGKTYACGSCAHTDLAVFSFHPVKTITTGEGGAVLTNDDSLAERTRILSSHGVVRETEKLLFQKEPVSPPWYHEMQVLGHNARITDIQCALGLSQLSRLSSFKRKRQKVARRYNQTLKKQESQNRLLLPPWPEGADPCYHLFVLRLGNAARSDRERLFHQLKNQGILPQIHYIPIYRQPYYWHKGKFEPSAFPESERYYHACLSLPLFPSIDNEVVDSVCKRVINLI